MKPEKRKSPEEIKRELELLSMYDALAYIQQLEARLQQNGGKKDGK